MKARPRKRSSNGALPSKATPWVIGPPSPSALAVVPFAPSAPTITSASISSSGTFTPSRNVRTGGDRLLGEVRVEPPPLRHQHERARACPCARTASASRAGTSIRSTSCSTTGAGSTGSCRTARSVSPPPHGLSRGNVALSRSSTFAPAARQVDRGDRPGRAGSDHGDVVAGHAAMVRPQPCLHRALTAGCAAGRVPSSRRELCCLIGYATPTNSKIVEAWLARGIRSDPRRFSGGSPSRAGWGPCREDACRRYYAAPA